MSRDAQQQNRPTKASSAKRDTRVVPSSAHSIANLHRLRGIQAGQLRLQYLQRTMGNQQLPGRMYITTSVDTNPETTADHLLGMRQYGPYLAYINGIDGLAWRPGLVLFVPDAEAIDPVEAQRILANMYAHEEIVIGSRRSNRSTKESVPAVAPDSAEADAARRLAQLALEHAAAQKFEAIEAKVRQAVGDSPLLVERYKGGPLCLSDGAAKFLREFLHPFGSNIDFKEQVDFVLKPRVHKGPLSVAAHIGRKEDDDGVLSPRWIVAINADTWNPSYRPTTAHRLALIVHELTHAVQDLRAWQLIDSGSFARRHTAEEKRDIDASYSVPEALAEIPLQDMHPLDGRFGLEQIASAVAAKLLQYFGAEP